MSHRGGFITLALTSIVGLILGLVYTWLIDPVELYNTTPALLRTDYRHDWVRMAALGYVADEDMDRAMARLKGLDHEDIQAALAALIETYALQGAPARTMRALSRLAQQMGVETPAMLVYLGTPSWEPDVSPYLTTPAPSPSPGATPPPPIPTATPTPFLSPLPIPSPYRVISQTLICTGTVPQLQVVVQAVSQEDPSEEPTPLPGVVLWLTWPGGADRAITGLRPQIDPGYADFTLQPEVPYALSVGALDAPILSNLTVQPCPGTSQGGSWRIIVGVQPERATSSQP